MSTARAVQAPIADHDADFYSWAMQTAAAIRAGRFDGVDWLSAGTALDRRTGPGGSLLA